MCVCFVTVVSQIVPVIQMQTTKALIRITQSSLIDKIITIKIQTQCHVTTAAAAGRVLYASPVSSRHPVRFAMTPPPPHRYRVISRTQKMNDIIIKRLCVFLGKHCIPTDFWLECLLSLVRSFPSDSVALLLFTTRVCTAGTVVTVHVSS